MNKLEQLTKHLLKQHTEATQEFTDFATTIASQPHLLTRQTGVNSAARIDALNTALGLLNSASDKNDGDVQLALERFHVDILAYSATVSSNLLTGGSSTNQAANLAYLHRATEFARLALLVHKFILLGVLL